MQKHTAWKVAGAASIVAAIFFAASSIARSASDAAIAWFPLLMGLAWLRIAGLFYQRGQQAEQRSEQE
jgi:hypothetical protein